MATSAESPLHSDTEALLNNEAGPKVFRVTHAPARLAVSGPGTLKSWDGNGFDAGIAFTESQTVTAPGLYELTLNAAGYASVQESSSG